MVIKRKPNSNTNIMALKYWTTWNFGWAFAEQIKLLPYTNSLHISLITTSIMGAYTVYTNEKILTIKIGKKRWEITGLKLLIGDFIFHHLPLIIALKYQKRENIKIKRCGRNGLMPVLVWYAYVNCFYNPHKIYNKNIHKLLISSILVYLSQGLYYHRGEPRFPQTPSFMN
jgi:hypothetical protein